MTHAELVLVAGADEELVEQRIAHALDLHHPVRHHRRLARAPVHLGLWPGGGAPSADGSLRIAGGVELAVAGQQSDRHLDGDGVDVEASHVIGSEIAGVVGVLFLREHGRDAGAVGQGPEIQRVEGGTQVDPERIVRRAGKHADSLTDLINTLFGQARIIRHGARPDVGGYGDQAAGQLGAFFAAYQRDRIALAQAQSFRTGTVQGGDSRRNHRGTGRDRRGRIGRCGDAVAGADETGEHAGRADFGAETELEAQIFLGVLIVIDANGVHNFRIEREIVRPVAGFQQRIDIEDQRDLAGVVVADESEKVGDVRLVVERGERRFAVVGGLNAGGDGQGQGQAQASAGKQAGHSNPPR